ncbi:MAG: DNA-binding protein [Opitutaceae bacterium]|nr:DNA-binding protein [Opitutaceae bacterium]
MKASGINYLVDAGPLVALLDSSDQWHRWSAGTLGVLGDVRLATTETALAEACHLLGFSRSAVLTVVHMVAAGMLIPFPTLAEDAGRIGTLLQKYPQMDLGDATLVVLSERIPRAKLITVDRTDFSVYRRADGTAVPSVMPPA